MKEKEHKGRGMQSLFQGDSPYMTNIQTEKTGLTILPKSETTPLDIYYENLRTDDEITFHLFVVILTGMLILFVGLMI